MNYKVKYLMVVVGLSSVLMSCEEDPKLPDNEVEFEAEVAGIAPEESSLSIDINLSREASEPVTITVALAQSGVSYGVDYTTLPEAVNSSISVTIPAGESQASIVLTKAAGVGFTGDESVSFFIGDIDGSAVMGEVTQTIVTFSEITVANAEMNIQGGGPAFPNRVFIDLSSNRQTTAYRTNWDFGFYTVEGQFRVILNSSLAMLAKPLDKNDLTTVTSADTVGMKATLTPDAFLTTNMAYVDDPAGSMAITAFAEISATDADNKVYIVNRGKDVNGVQRSWKKVRVLRNGTGYAMQYADINSSTFETVQVSRLQEFLFRYVNLDLDAVVTVEPEKDKWDIAYTPFMNSTNAGSGPVPYMFNDIIIQNRNAVETVELLIANAGEYTDFDEADLSGITFATSQINIGSKWRTGGGPSSAPALKTDRFYLVKDAEGNIYKMKFTALTQDGERGRPAIEFGLVKAGV